MCVCSFFFTVEIMPVCCVNLHKNKEVQTGARVKSERKQEEDNGPVLQGLIYAYYCITVGSTDPPDSSF